MVFSVCILLIDSSFLVLGHRFGLNARRFCDLSVLFKRLFKILDSFPKTFADLRYFLRTKYNQDDHKNDDQLRNTRHPNSQLNIGKMRIHDDYLNFSNLELLFASVAKTSLTSYFISLHSLVDVNFAALSLQCRPVIPAFHECQNFKKRLCRFWTTAHKPSERLRDCSEFPNKMHCLVLEKAFISF